MSPLPSGERTWIDEAADRFEQAWTAGPPRPLIEDFLAEADPERRVLLLEELVQVECELRKGRGEAPTPEEYMSRFVDHPEVVAAAFGLDRPRKRRRPAGSAENMLFGLLALQNHFIDRDTLVAAFDAWVADKAKPLGQILLDRGALTAARHGVLAQLVREHIEQHGRDPERSLAVLRVLPDVRQRLEDVADLDFQCTLMSLDSASRRRSQSGLDPDATTDAPGTASEEQEWARSDARFHLIRFHDRGNLGEVYLARDQQLHRVVALKRIKKSAASDEDKRTRFVVEAEITGRLEHPCIVPVYGLATFNDGRPFYAMRFIRGDNL
jgi:hypothetical protein